jgi:hypothetical protein
MADSFAAEAKAFLQQRMEQDPVFHAYTTQGVENVPVADMVGLIWTSLGSHGKLLVRIAEEIDELRAAIERGSL